MSSCSNDDDLTMQNPEPPRNVAPPIDEKTDKIREKLEEMLQNDLTGTSHKTDEQDDAENETNRYADELQVIWGPADPIHDREEKQASEDFEQLYPKSDIDDIPAQRIPEEPKIEAKETTIDEWVFDDTETKAENPAKDDSIKKSEPLSAVEDQKETETPKPEDQKDPEPSVQEEDPKEQESPEVSTDEQPDDTLPVPQPITPSEEEKGEKDSGSSEHAQKIFDIVSTVNSVASEADQVEVLRGLLNMLPNNISSIDILIDLKMFLSEEALHEVINDKLKIVLNEVSL